jgi:DNA polymerase III delta prime subunit
MEQPLFLNKYQPLYFTDFKTDDDIIEILNTLIGMNNLNILFIGGIGSGKTTFINAVIREYYNGVSFQEYNNNILHINSLKEQGINYYRNEVKTFCQTCSSIKHKKKIIVLDDIDLINEQSQQVFRNYVDKYSKNIHFISSCSNPQKVIESLQSRLLPTKIKQLQRHNLVKIMNRIINIENISIHPDATEFILNVCNNNVKILINYMEKMKLLNQPIDLTIANNICTNICFFHFTEYTHHIKNHELYKAICILYRIYDKGYSVVDILDNYFLYIKITDILNEHEKYSIIPFICKYITIFHNIHEDEIELALFSNNVYKCLHNNVL